MPELPEVETIRKGLETYLLSKIISDIEIRLAKQLLGDPQKAIGAEVIAVRRFGKGLVIDLSNDQSITIHIKMTGQLIYRGPEVPLTIPTHPGKVGKLPGPHTHVIFKLITKDKQGAFLFYNDIRQFGWIRILPTDDVKKMPFFKELGPEFFKDLDVKTFQWILAKNKMMVKVLLLDQKKVAGVGNIYANDGLYVAKIDPKRPAASLTSQEAERLYYALVEVLQKGLETGGASEWQYVNALGQTGEYQNFFQVYGKQGTKCPRDGSVIQKITLGGRGTFFCPTCQS